MVQRLPLLLFLAPLALAAPQEEENAGSPATQDGYSLPSSVPASDVLNGLYGSNIPTAVTGAVATSLASALYSYELKLQDDPGYKSAANAVYMAMATASDSDAIFSSFETADPMHADYTTAGWFKSGVPEDAQTAIESYYNGYVAVETSVLGTDAAGATPTTATGAQSGSASVTGTGSDAGSAPTETGATSVSSGGAPGPTRVAMAGLAAGVALGAFAAV
ncbi:hypothetical protein SLS62_011247 [Diatrype stigma]|uniref:Uncharacterized protein n=1 Tax=Diatrype stigma TaxID=117547 RepID=A0AAN9YFX5_9PEZI